MANFRYETSDGFSSPFCLLSYFERSSLDWETMTLARVTGAIVNVLPPRDTACVVYPTAKLLEQAAATHHTYKHSYGLRCFEFVHDQQPEEDINNALMKLAGGQVHTVLTVASELGRFADNTFDCVVFAKVYSADVVNDNVMLLAMRKAKPAGVVKEVDSD